MGGNNNTKYFCNVCYHGVMNMEKHMQSKEHKRRVRKETSTGHEGTNPRLPSQLKAGNNEAAFPGHLLLKQRQHGG